MSRRQRDEFGVLMRLLTVTGSCLGTNVLRRVFPQELSGVDKSTRAPWRELWGDFEEKALRESATLDDTALFCRGVLEQVLRWDSECILAGDQIPSDLVHEVPEHHEVLRPTWVLGDASDSAEGFEERAPWERILVTLLPPDVDPEEIQRKGRWKESPVGKMAALLRGTGHRAGIVTNGTNWVLVSAPPGGPDGTATWPAELMISEILLLRAFISLLSMDRTLGSPEGERLSDVLASSVDEQKDVTEKLGLQMRRSVELFVQELDRADRDRLSTTGSDGSLLKAVPPALIYESAVTFLMRIVFLLCAEERKLLPIDQSAYSENYAASTLRESLEQVSDRLGPDVLELRTGAYQRLLALFRLIHGGSDHPDLPMVAHGGGVFDPDRYPFLEGRPQGTSWRNTPADPPAIDDRTILKILDALQLARERGEDQVYEVSFEALDVEQLGHVYECLLDHTAHRAPEPILSLQGAQGDEPEIALSDLETWMEKGKATLKKEIRQRNGPTPKKVEALLVKEPTPEYGARVRQRLGTDADQWERVLPYTGLLRDVDGDPVIYPTGGLYVTSGTDRRNTGTNYTPRTLTEPIVKTTLEMLVYRGPTEGKPREEWQLKSAQEILDLKVCDPACGSGAFLAEACRYLGKRLVEAWSIAEESDAANTNSSKKTPTLTTDGISSTGAPDEHLLPESDNERELLARRLIAGRCLYGVDKNPIATEMAKLSLWLLTMDQGRPFSFVDHAIRSGDSLVGLTKDQIEAVTWEEVPLTRQAWLSEQLDTSRQRRGDLIALGDHHVSEKQRLYEEARESSDEARLVGDYLIASFFNGTNAAERRRQLALNQEVIDHWRLGSIDDQELQEAVNEFRGGETANFAFHWEIEFPEVFSAQTNGFDAVIGNPPFLAGIKKGGVRTAAQKDMFAIMYKPFASGTYDLCLMFWARALLHLLNTSGRYGMLSPTVLLSNMDSWKSWMHENCRPDYIGMYPIDAFSGVKIRTSAICGSLKVCDECIVVNNESQTPAGCSSRVLKWADGHTNWYEAVQALAGGIQTNQLGDTAILGEVTIVSAGCTTADAYELKKEVIDSSEGKGKKLVTTGAIDRYLLKWGDMRIRYLKNDYTHPRWPIIPIDGGLVRALAKQSRKKILVGGLTAVVEAWLDEHGESAGVVQTWVIKPIGEAIPTGSVWWNVLLGILNSATFSRIYVDRHGAEAMNGKQITIKKKSITQMIVPRFLNDPQSSLFCSDHGTDFIDEWSNVNNVEALARSLSTTVESLQSKTLPSDEVCNFDKLAHYLAGALYGRSEEGCESDYYWWCERCSEPPSEMNRSDLAKLLVGFSGSSSMDTGEK
jgi:hypothetical protein